MVTNCFKEVVTAFRKLLYENKNCELPFSQIGKLQIKNKIITMKFYQEFLERQNQNLKEQMEENKKHYSDWNADQSEYQVNFYLLLQEDLMYSKSISTRYVLEL